jgi:hypothetical protein
MVRLIGAGVNEADRPQGASAGRNRILVKGGRAGYGNPHFLRRSTKQQVAARLLPQQNWRKQ